MYRYRHGSRRDFRAHIISDLLLFLSLLDKAAIDTLFTQCDASEGYALRIDLDAQTVTRPEGVAHTFAVDAFRKECLVNGWDDIGLTLRHADKIRAYEDKRRAEQPWLFAG